MLNPYKVYLKINIAINNHNTINIHKIIVISIKIHNNINNKIDYLHNNNIRKVNKFKE